MSEKNLDIILKHVFKDEKQFFRIAQYVAELQKLDLDGKIKEKFHPAMSEMQEIIDALSENPIDISSAPDDVDHNEYEAECPKCKAMLKFKI